MGYSTLPCRFLQAVDEHPSPRAQMVRRGERWDAISSKEFLRRVAGLACTPAFPVIGAGV